MEYEGRFYAETPRIPECEVNMLEHEEDRDIVENEYAGSFYAESPRIPGCEVNTWWSTKTIGT